MRSATNRRPSLKQLEAIKRNYKAKTTMTMRDFMKETYGIVTFADLYAYINKNTKLVLDSKGKVIPGKQESNYDIMVRCFGEDIADRLMRRIEVASWDL